MAEDDFVLVSQSKLFKFINPNIATEIVDKDDNSGKLLIARNVSEADIPNLVFITNSPQYKTYMSFTDILCFLSPNNIPQLNSLPIYGLKQNVKARIERSDTEGFISNHTTHKPFAAGFGENGLSIGELIDNLTSLSRDLPDTYGIPKTFTILLDPPEVKTNPVVNTICNGNNGKCKQDTDVQINKYQSSTGSGHAGGGT